MEWQPIETAPKDGTRILAYGKIALETECGVGTVAWNALRALWWADPNEATEYEPWPCELTHWMLIPAPPSDEQRNG